MIESILILLFFIGALWLFITMYKKSKHKSIKKTQNIHDYIEDIRSKAVNTTDIKLLRKLYCESFQYRCRVIPKEKEHLEKVFKYIKNKIEEFNKIK